MTPIKNWTPAQKFVGVIVVLVTIAVFSQARPAPASRGTPAPTAPPKPGSQTVAAFSLCKDVVMPPRLKAPSTAHFAGITDSKVTYAPNSDAYMVESYVDAQNGFGAQIRTAYTCLVSPRSGDQWAVIAVSTTP